MIYVYLILLELSLAVVQQPSLKEKHVEEQNFSATKLNDHWIPGAQVFSNSLIWASWARSIHVGTKLGLSNGILFFAIGFTASTVAILVCLRAPPLGLPAIAVGLLVSLFVLGRLLALLVAI
jgi:hypothetical protein